MEKRMKISECNVGDRIRVYDTDFEISFIAEAGALMLSVTLKSINTDWATPMVYVFGKSTNITVVIPEAEKP